MSDPLNAATTFATIIGLIANYRQEAGSAQQLDHQKFIEWLQYHRHEEIKKLICNTASLQNEIDTLLSAEQAVISKKLDDVSNLLATLMSQMLEFQGLAQIIVPQAILSEQAVFVLRQLVESDSQYIIYIDMGSNCVLQLQSGEQVRFTELRFLRDDLEKLVQLGLLTIEQTDQTTSLLHVTRDAVRFIAAA